VENFIRAKAHYLVKGPLKTRDALVVWGAGQTGRRLSKHLIREGCTPEVFVDITPKKIGSTLRNVPIIGPESLLDLWTQWHRPFLVVAVSSRGARVLIREELARMGLREGDDFLCAA
jgi:FlaA1/EpsC-like NDP-sugar epimerase